MIVQPTTDLTPFTGRRIAVNGLVAHVHTIHHSAEAQHCRAQLDGGVWGDCHYEPCGDLKGGSSSFWWPYGVDLEVQP